MNLRTLLGVLLAWLGLSAAVLADEFEVIQAKARRDQNAWVLDARVRYGFTATALEALDNGVPLTLEVRAQVRRAGSWIWSPSLVDKQFLYQIRFQPLTNQYQVVDVRSGSRRAFVTRASAVAALGEVDGVPLIEQSALEPGQKYQVHLKAALDIEALPLPLRPLAYLKPSWQLSSAWSTWPLAP